MPPLFSAWSNVSTFALILLTLSRMSVATEEDVGAVFGHDEKTVSLATGYTKPIDIAPAVTSVITNKDIESLGVRTLGEALETVPGLHVSTARGSNTILSIRGIFSELSPHTLFMVNGIPVNQGFITTFGQVSDMPVNNIERVEVIRGPGSALYGSDAFSGVVNVITRTTAGFKGTEIGARAGYFDTYDGWILHGSRHGPVDVGFALSGWTSDGYQRTVDADAQTQLDSLFGTRASLAPGDIHTGRDGVDLRLDLPMGNWRYRAAYYALMNVESGVGFVNALDPVGSLDYGLFTTDLNYNGRLNETTEVSFLFSYLDTHADLFTQQFPPGAFGTFPDGVLDEVKLNGTQKSLEATLNWSGIAHNLLRVGAGFYDVDMFDIAQRDNSFIGSLPNGQRILVPSGQFTSPTEFGVQLALPETYRHTIFGFVQDEWNFAKDFTLTAGVRADGYSDIGVVASPRASLAWQATHDVTLKFLYGRAFRAPNFAEQFSRDNNVTAVGNPDLVEETIDTYEFVLSKQTRDYRLSLNLYRYDIQKTN